MVPVPQCIMQTPAGMLIGRSDMPAETPAAYSPHERTGKTAFSKSLVDPCHFRHSFTRRVPSELGKSWLVGPAYAASMIGVMVKIRGTKETAPISLNGTMASMGAKKANCKA